MKFAKSYVWGEQLTISFAEFLLNGYPQALAHLMPVDQRRLSVWLCHFLLAPEGVHRHPQLRVRHQLTLTYLSLTLKTCNFRPCGFWPHFSLLMSVFSREGVAPWADLPWTATALYGPMAKVGNLDPRINDNHTYLPWVVTHSIQVRSFQSHIRKFSNHP